MPSETTVLLQGMERTNIIANWGPARGRTLHHDPVFHLIVEGARMLCSGGPGQIIRHDQPQPGRACPRCVREWRRQTDECS